MLVFAFNYSQGFAFLLPFVVIIPLYFLTKREMIQALRIGAYIFVFLENQDNICWESRLIMYDEQFKQNSHKHIPLNTYLGLSLLCVTLSVVNTNYSNFDVYSIICLIFQVLLAVSSVILFSFMSPNYAKIKNLCIKHLFVINLINLYTNKSYFLMYIDFDSN